MRGKTRLPTPNATEAKKVGSLISDLDYPQGPPLAERDELRRQITADLDRLELLEEAIVVEAQQFGLTIARRADVRPSIILSITLSEAA